MGKVYFSEEQRFSSPWIWIAIAVGLSIAVIPILVELYNQAILGNSTGSNPERITSLTIVLGVTIFSFVITYVLFKKMKLITKVRSDCIAYRYPPFILKEKMIRREEISRFEVRVYKPIKEYGGWGMRHNFAGAGRAFNVKGNKGLQLYLKNGKKILFGTQRPDAIRRAVEKMMRED